MRRGHLRGHQNILQRRLVRAGAFTLGLILRQLIGSGTPRGLQGRLGVLAGLVTALIGLSADRWGLSAGSEPPLMLMTTYRTDNLAGAPLG
jgi:transposase